MPSLHLHGTIAPTTFCLSCHKDYGSVARVQMHLKGSDKCLRRVAHLFPPMEPDDIVAVEAVEKRLQKRQKAGCWQDFTAPRPAVIAYGPPLPTWEERRPGRGRPRGEHLSFTACPDLRSGFHYPRVGGIPHRGQIRRGATQDSSLLLGHASPFCFTDLCT